EAKMVKLEELDRMKTTFIALLSHNLRTPITSLTDYLASIENSFQEMGKPISNAILKMKQSTSSLAEIVEDTVIISELQSGRVTLSFEPITIYDLIQNIIGNSPDI